MSGLLPHEHYMRRAIELGKQNLRLPFGALIVDRLSAKIPAEGWNRTEMNPIWHGEIDVTNRQAEDHPTIDGTQLVLYTTAESCPMCQSAVVWTGIETVVFGSSIRFLQSRGWWQIDIYVMAGEGQTSMDLYHGYSADLTRVDKLARR